MQSHRNKQHAPHTLSHEPSVRAGHRKADAHRRAESSVSLRAGFEPARKIHKVAGYSEHRAGADHAAFEAVFMRRVGRAGHHAAERSLRPIDGPAASERRVEQHQDRRRRPTCLPLKE